MELVLFFWIFATKGKYSHEIKLWAQTKLLVGQFGVAEFNAHVCFWSGRKRFESFRRHKNSKTLGKSQHFSSKYNFWFENDAFLKSSPRQFQYSHENTFWGRTNLIVGQVRPTEFNTHVFEVVGHVSEAVDGRKIQNLMNKLKLSVWNTRFELWNGNLTKSVCSRDFGFSCHL